MTLVQKTKKALFYVTVIMTVLFAFVFEGIVDNGLTQGAIWYISIYFVVVLGTVISFWDYIKKVVRDIMGEVVFEDEDIFEDLEL